MLIGFPLLTLGVALGAYWAYSAWGRYWGWDPKETSALVTWLVYAGYLHARNLRGWKGQASYFDVVVGSETNTQAAWYYADPKPEAMEIKDHVAFWHGVKVVD